MTKNRGANIPADEMSLDRKLHDDGYVPRTKKHTDGNPMNTEQKPKDLKASSQPSGTKFFHPNIFL